MLRFNFVGCVSLHHIYLKESELKLNTDTIHCNSTYVEISTKVEILMLSAQGVSKLKIECEQGD